MRVNIREQLAALGLVLVLVSLAIVSIPTWLFVYGFVVDVRTQDLAQVASLKASQVASLLAVLQSTCTGMTSRLIIQQSLFDYYGRNGTSAQEADAGQTLQAALFSSGSIDLLQAQIYARNSTAGSDIVLSQTGSSGSQIALPYTYPNGTAVMLGGPGLGYPPELYPNFTHPANDSAGMSEPATVFSDIAVTGSKFLLLGPLQVNDSYALISLTQPIFAIGRPTVVLGYLTVVASATSLFRIESSSDGLGDTGQAFIVGPNTQWNRFDRSVQLSNESHAGNSTGLGKASARFILPLVPQEGQRTRDPFLLKSYPLALEAFSSASAAVAPAGDLNTVNEKGESIAAGYARLKTTLVEWIVLVEQAQSEAYEPIVTLRKILLACVFGTAGLALVLILPCAHISVLPIRRLKAATEASVAPPGSGSTLENHSPRPTSPSEEPLTEKSRDGFFKRLVRFFRRKTRFQYENRSRHGAFRIPQRVEEKKHVITDELTDLTKTFNEMSDELYVQYTHLEEKVAERTKELEISKKAAETANESKTLFIANMSHELKTPLNGILGICAVCMEEDNVKQIQGSLKTVYESGNLLLRLLDDLLSFSRNQASQGVNIEESEFQLGDIGDQISAIFLNSTRDKAINFSVSYTNGMPKSTRKGFDNKSKVPPMLHGQSPLKEIHVLGDQHRVLQVLLNLVGNSLKFTPKNGSIRVSIRCLGRASGKASGRDDVVMRGDKVRRQSQVLEHAFQGDASTCSRSTAPRQAPQRGTSLSVESHSIARDHQSETPTRASSSRASSPGSESKQYLFEFAVEDTGQGIPEDMQQRVFEPFIQADSRLSKKFGGAGLGLTICRQLATLMGGSITLSSTPSAGTSVFLHVPLTLSRQNTSHAIPQDGEGFPSIPLTPTTAEETRVLIADDNPVNIEVVSRMLKLEHIYNISTAKDGQEAVDLVKAELENNRQYTVIFMDIQMPRLDGLQSTALIRKLGYSAPIVALTASAEKDIVSMGIDSGMDTVMSKPIRRPALKQVLSAFAAIPVVSRKQDV
ncbi:hypothetical protein GQ53DRAFT_825538 [Thozetella sp. PMI_491]|nr:hypothetical protein GQ53DRAFT_825538 [Thozetella sp. PMI_491]